MGKSFLRKSFKHTAKSVLLDAKQYISFFAAILLIQTILFSLLTVVQTTNAYRHEKLNEDYDYHIAAAGMDTVQLTNIINTIAPTRSTDPCPYPIMYEPDENDDVFSVHFKLEQENYRLQAANIRDLLEKNGVTDITYSPLYTSDPSMKWDFAQLWRILLAVVLILTALHALWYYCLCRPPKQNSDDGYNYRSTLSKQFGGLVKKSVGWVLLLLCAASLVIFLININFGNDAVFVLVFLLVTAICVGFLTALYNVRVNHYKFQYGIYMTFGANFSKLYGSAVREMLLVSALTAIPATAAAFGTAALIFSGGEAEVAFRAASVLHMIILNVFIVMLSVYLPMKVMSRRPPIELLSAQDNSNLVISPRRSFKIFGKTFPNHYELYGLWRFRKYFLRLTAIAVSFSTIFLCGLYLSEMNSAASDSDVYEFVITRTDESSYPLGESSVEIINAVNGVKYCFWSAEQPAGGIQSHMVLRDENTVGGDYTVSTAGGSSRDNLRSLGYLNSTNSFKYVAYDETLIDAILNNSIYTVEGDLRSVLADSNKIIISENIRSNRAFSFSVGDTVVIATVTGDNPSGESLSEAGGSAALRYQIENYTFSYNEYTVGAVIGYSGNDDRIIVGVGEQTYQAITGAEPVRDNILVFTDPDASVSEFSGIMRQIEDELEYTGYRVRETYNTTAAELAAGERHGAVIIAVSVMIMLVSPLIWFFSQLHFYRRRGKEFYVLRAMGAVGREIKKLYIIAGLLLSALSLVITLAMSFAADWLIYIFCLYFLSVPGDAVGAVYSFYMPPAALIACLLTAVLCGFLSSWLPSVLAGRLKSKADSLDGLSS